MAIDYFEDDNSSLYKSLVKAGYQYEEKNDGEGGSFYRLVGVNPPKTDYAPPRQRMVKAQAPQPEKEEKKKPAPQPQKLPDQVIDGKQRVNDFDSLVSRYGINRSSSPSSTSLESSLNGIKGDAVAMAENAWTSRKDSDKKYKQAKEKAQAFNGPGQTSTTVDYNNITGENVAERVRRENQSMTHTFKNNWKDYLNPQLPHLLSPEGM